MASYVDDDKFDARVIADGEVVEWKDLSDLILKGTPVYGGAWVFDAESRHDDGQFEVVPFQGKRDWISKALVHLDGSGAAAEGLAKIGVRHSQNLRARHIELDLMEHPGGLPIMAQLDGEEFPATPRADIEILPRALRLIVPEDKAAQRD